MNDAIPICRSVEKHWVFEDAEYFKLWYCILSNTQYTVPVRKKVYQGIMYTQHRGEFLFGRREWSRRYGVSEQRIRKFMDLLVADGMVVRTQLTRKFSIYRVVNYDKFNPLKKPVDADVVPPTEPTETPQTTHEKPTDNPQTTTIKKDKIVKKVKKDIYGSLENVFLTQQEYSKLSDEFTVTNEAIEFLSQYIEEKGYKSKSHYLAIRRWVIDAVAKKNGGSNERVLRSKHEQSSSTGHSSDGNSASKIPEGFWG